MKYSQPYRDAVAIQRRMMQVLDSVPIKDLANVAKGYCSLEQLKLRLRMKPAPKPIDTEKLAERKGRKRVGIASPSED